MSHVLVNKVCFYLLFKGQGHILCLCHLTWHLARTLAAVAMSCMPRVGKSESLHKKNSEFLVDSAEISFAVLIFLCAF